MSNISQQYSETLRALYTRRLAQVSLPAWSVIAVLCVTAAAAAVFSLVPFMPMGIATHDWAAYLDSMYRMSWGQIPHVDFDLPYGALAVLLPFVAERIFPSLHPLLGAELLIWILIAPAVAFIAAGLRNPLAVIGFVVLVAGAVLLPFTSDHIQTMVSYHAIYNRFGIALLLIIGVWTVMADKRKADGWILGYLLTLLFFIKITSFAAAVGLLGAKFLLERDVRRAALPALLVFCGLLALSEATSGIVSGYIRNILDMVAANDSSGLSRIFLAIYRQRAATVAAILLAIVFAFSVRTASPAAGGRAIPELRRRYSIPIDALLLLGVALLAESQNGGGIFLLPLAALLFKPDLFDWRFRLPAVTAAICAAVVIAPVLDLWVGRSIALATKFKREWFNDAAVAQAYPGFRAERLVRNEGELHLALWNKDRDLINAKLATGDDRPWLVLDGAAMDYAIAKSAAEAAAVFKAGLYAGRLKAVISLDWPDLMPRLLGTAPVRGVKIALDAERTVALDAAGAEKYLRNVDGVFMPICPIEKNRAALRRMFVPALERSFTKVPLTTCWELYVRR